jgi:signal transduction histidine kinase
MAVGRLYRDNETMSGGPGERARHEQMLHDLRTPLSVIKGSIEALRGHWDAIEDGRRAELFERALINVEDLATAIDDIGRSALAEGNGLPLGRVGRAGLAGLEVTRQRDEFVIEISLERGGRRVVGRARASAGRAGEQRAVARALLEALRGGGAERNALESAEVIEVGGDRVAVVMLSRGSSALTGAALVAADEHDAIARAALHALNRTLEAPA